ncbi:TonB-dependent receptor [Salinimicrobium sp. CDJ15-81-2]|nr:TonB-dependent receptor [Salinimicrobium nanhaiense]
MMKKSVYYLLFIILLQAFPANAQLESLQQLPEVILSDIHLHRSSSTNHVQVLKDSVLDQNQPALTSVLKFNSPLYFRENGPGMVASASFRGTTASQTAVIWNGININSQFTGQTDFNTILTSGFDEVAIRSGGGSVLYGSGAIGGSVHLNNRFRFNRGLQNKIRLKYGSFDTRYGSLDSEYSNERLSLQFAAARHQSDNDFRYPDSDKINDNGDFSNDQLALSIGYLVDHNNTLKFYTNYFDGDRGFSGTLTAPSKSKYEDRNSRNLLEWNSYFGSFKSNVRLAYLDEHYKYFENRGREIFSYGKAKTGIVKYDLRYNLSSKAGISGLLEYQNSRGEGTNFSGINERNTGSAGLLFIHDLSPLKYEVSARADFSDRYNSPLLFSAGVTYAFTNFYSAKLNVSRNYRIPTFNDLFWYSGGNLDLKPEKSLQAELGQNLHFSNLKFSLTGFVIKTEDLLRWVPSNSGLWLPENTKKALNYGLETTADWQKEFAEHEISFSGTYAYTKAVDQSLDKDLIYVPAHKITASAGYRYRNLSAYFQYLYNGQVFTSSDNNYSLPGYSLSNLGISYSFFGRRMQAGLEMQNLFDKAYQSMPSRPMPGRSLYSSLTFKF